MNKKSIFFIISIITLLVSSLAVLANQQFKLIVNGKEVKTDMIVKDGITYLPLRTISNELGLALEFANGNVVLNSTTPSTSSIATSTTSTQSIVATPSIPSNISPSVVKPKGEYKYSNNPLSIDEILRGGKKDMTQITELYESMGLKVTIEEDVAYLDEGSYGFGCTYTLKLDDGVESEWEKTSIYVIDPVGWRYYINDEPIPAGKTWGGANSHHTIKTEYNKK